MDNISQQIEEIEVLNSIYDSSWINENQTGTSMSYSIAINPEVKLFVTLPPTYPSSEAPIYELLAPTLDSKKKNEINTELNSIYLNSNNSPVLFQWIEKLKELVETSQTAIDTKQQLENNSRDGGEKQSEDGDPKRTLRTKNLHIIHGPIIQDRKSVFQGHVCEVFSEEDVRCVKELLLENKKIAQATHNIIAYRILSSNGIMIQDCDDDGENHAGGRLLHLLQITNVINVVVVVSRWYGGIHLGPDRFKHINNAAREVLKEGRFLLS